MYRFASPKRYEPSDESSLTIAVFAKRLIEIPPGQPFIDFPPQFRKFCVGDLLVMQSILLRYDQTHLHA
jgi:hypothetical protein